MSFVDLMASHVWSEADIKARLHAEIRSEISELMETEINRALQGAALGVHKLTPQEMQAVQQFKLATDRVAAMGVQARADMALLHQVLAMEAAARELASLDPQDPETQPQREAAQAVLDTASEPARALFERRNPTPEDGE